MRSLLLLAVFSASALAQPASQPVAPESDGGIVYGDKWAFLVNAPDGWRMTTHSDMPVNAAFFQVTPAEPTTGAAPTMMYVTVTLANPQTPDVAALIKQDEEDFRSESKALEVTRHPELKSADGNTSVVRRFEKTRDGRSELVAYHQYGEAMYELVLSAPNSRALEMHEPAFFYLVNKFSAMHIQFQNGAQQDAPADRPVAARPAGG